MIITADWHIRSTQDFSKPWIDGCTTRLKKSLETQSQIFGIAEECKDQDIVMAGDYFHDWNGPDTPENCWAARRLYGELDMHPKIKLHLLPGNHDMPNKANSRVHTLEQFKGHPRIHVYDKPAITEIQGHKILFVPYTNKLDNFRQTLHQFEGQANILISHIDLLGAASSLDGYIPPNQILTIDDFAAYAITILGHYHMPQVFKKNGNEVWYTGSMLPVMLADYDQKKRVLSVVDENQLLKIESIRLNVPHIRKHTIQEAPFPELDPVDWHYIECPPTLVKELRKFYKDLLIKIKPFKAKIKSESRLELKPGVSPILQYVKHKHPELDLQMLAEIGQDYFARCC